MAAYELASKSVSLQESDDPIEYYFERGWTDGLPVVPPTAEKIGAFLDAAGRSPSEILGTEPVRGRVVTVEKVAINAVMAGCRPEYFPVVVATIEAMLEPEHNLHAVTVSTMGAAPLLVVNGPVVDEIGLNSGVSVFGPGRRANATIGRAIRLTIMNVTGALPGDLDQSSLGHAGKYTWCIAEDGQSSPWQPLHVDRGFAADESTVTVFPGLVAYSGDQQRRRIAGGGAEERSGRPLRRRPRQRRDRHRPHAGEHRTHRGWGLDEKAGRAVRLGAQQTDGGTEWDAHGYPAGSPDDESLIGVVDGPEGITIIVAGGKAGAFTAIIPLWGGGSNSRSVTKVIQA